MNEGDLGRLLLEGLTEAVGSLTGAPAAQSTGLTSAGPQWTITLAAEGAVRAACVLAIDDEGANALTKVASGQEGDAAVEALLREIVTQAVAAVVARDETANIQLTLMSVVRNDAAPSGTPLSVATVSVAGAAVPLHVMFYAVAAPKVAPTRSRQTHSATHAEQQQARLDAILDIDLPVVVRFGRTEMPLRAVTRIGPGSVIDLGRSPDDPVELLVSDRVVARGEVVVVGGNYGIRIVDVVSPSERMRSMEG